MSVRCDVCDERPATHALVAAGTETWACDECSDESFEAVRAHPLAAGDPGQRRLGPAPSLLNRDDRV